MNVKRTLIAMIAAATMLLSLGGAANAAPNANAPCIAVHHAVPLGGQNVAALAQEGGVVLHAQTSACEHHDMDE